MIAKVVALFPEETSRARMMPTHLSAHEAETLLRWGMRNGFCAEEIRFGVETVRDWARSRAREPLKRDWVRTIEAAMREGWALRGYQKWSEATSGGSINPRTGRKIIKRTPVTEDYIARYLAKLG